MAQRARSLVKFFLQAQKVVVISLMKYGDPKVEKTEVYIDGKGRVAGKPTQFRFRLGPLSNHMALVLIVPYFELNGQEEPDGDPPITPTARIRVTITNKPPATEPEEVVIDETENGPEDEPGDNPGDVVLIP